jgi:hypothetical protein
MRRRSVLSINVLTLALWSIGCTGGSDGRPSPNAPSAERQTGSSGNEARPPQPPRPDPPPATGTCIASQAQWAVGEPASAALLDRARRDATASVARFIRPNEAITMEYSPARLNLYLDEHDVVRSAVCG